LDNQEILDKTRKEQTAILYYYYAKERFRKVIETVNQLSLNYKNENTIETCQISEVYGLSLRKIGDFSLASNAFNNTIKIAEKLNSDYQKSIGYMNLAKIDYHKIDFESAYNNNTLGIKALEKVLTDQIKKNSKFSTSTRLFLAEYNRLSAETFIWNSDLKNANLMLNNSSNIYDDIHYRDRYFVRYLYTSAQCKIKERNYEVALNLLNDSNSIARNNYDKATINYFYSQLYLFRYFENNEDIHLTQSVEHLNKSIYQFELIEANIELIESKVLRAIITIYNYSQKSNISLGNFTSNYKWANYTFKFYIEHISTITKNDRITYIRQWRMDTNQEKTDVFLCLQN
jgi:hypothetical protein